MATDRDFRTFCERHNLCPLPASVGNQVGNRLRIHLSAAADCGLKAGTIGCRLAAIAAAHQAANLESPTGKTPVKLTAAGIGRALGTR